MVAPPASKAARAADTAVHWLPHLSVVVIGPAFLAFGGLAAELNWSVRGLPLWLPLTIIGLGVLVAATRAFARRQRRLDALAAELRALQHRATTSERALVRIVREELDRMRLKAHHYSTERVSLFRYDRDGFILVGRFSADPKFGWRLGHEQYPADQGCLGRAWRDGVAGEPGLPSGGTESQPPTKQWLDAQETRHQVPRDAASSMTMRSRSYAAIRIAGSAEPVGVIVFESLLTVSEAQAGSTSAVLDVMDLKALLDADFARLASLLEASRPMPGAAVRAHLEAMQDEYFGVSR